MNLLDTESLSLVSHYTSYATLLEIVKSGSLKMGQLENVNDIAEVVLPLMLFNQRLPDGSHPPNVGIISHEAEKVLSQTYQKFVVSACFSKSSSVVDEHVTVTPSMASFGNRLLWAHYGDHWRGVALVFDPEEFENQVRLYFADKLMKSEIWVGDLDYKDRSNLNIEFDATRFVGLNKDQFESEALDQLAPYARKLLFKKDNEWNYEQEWRVGAITSSEGPHYIPYGDALKAVVLGPRVKAYLRPLKEIGVPIYAIGVAGGRKEVDLLGPISI